jgi:oxygen-independent coproporphyrinogen-3 oxidase
LSIPRHVYVHVPFCARRCSYCDFAIAVRRHVPVDEYLAALEGELGVRLGPASRAAPVDTIYVGGGTPSRLGGDGIARLLDLLRRWFEPVSGAELTIEANPDDVTPAAVRAWRAAGVNRVSLGGQSFDDRVLAWMHRSHDAAQITRAADLVRQAGIDDWSFDLIYAVPEALGRDWARDLAQTVALAPPHVSMYGLTVEPATPLGRWHARGEVQEAPEERYEAEFLLAHGELAAAGYEHYEVSNWAQPGRRSRHNSSYWSGVPYLGLGPGAHGFDGAERRWNAAAYAAWQRAAAAGRDPVEGREVLTDENRVAEGVYLGLRTTTGLPLLADERPGLEPWLAAGWAELRHERLRLTPTGWLRLDALAATLTVRRSR